MIVRFHPGGAAPFLPFPLHDLQDCSLRLEAVWKQEADAGWEQGGAALAAQVGYYD